MTRILRALQVLRATLREVFDEAAYTRFLERTQTTSSPSAYAAFWRERESIKVRPNRCC